MKKFFAPRVLPADIDWVLLLIRLVVGYAFILIGWGKIQNPTGWMPPEMGFPGPLLALAAIAEFGGGIALLLGLLTRLAALGIAITMVVAIGVHINAGDPFINPTGGGNYQAAALYLLLAALFVFTGPGRFSLDHFLFRKGSSAANSL